VNGLHLYVAHHDDIAVVQQCGAIAPGKRVAPVGSALVGEVEACACACDQLAGAGDEVCVDVRFGDVLDGQLLGFGRLEEGVHRARGVDHDRLAGHATADQVAGLREVRVVEAP
jgi:hypothetical protein